MRARCASALIDELDGSPPPIDAGEIAEAKAFLRWMADEPLHVPRLPEYDLVIDEDGDRRCRPRPGLRRSGSCAATRSHAAARRLGAKALDAGAGAPRALVLTKANSRATVHRPSYLDYIGVKRFDADGEAHRRAALPRPLHDAPPTRRARAADPDPARQGRDACSTRAGFAPDSHDAQGAARDPRGLPARRAVPDRRRRAVRRSRWGSSGSASASACGCSCAATRSSASSSCLVFIPRDRFNTENRERVAADPARGVRRHAPRLDAAAVRVGARARALPRRTAPDGVAADYDVAEIEARLVDARAPGPTTCATRCVEEHGEERGLAAAPSATARRSRPATAPTGPRAPRSPTSAGSRSSSRGRRSSIMSLYRPLEAPDGSRALQAVQLRRGDLAVGRAADLRAHGRHGHRRAPVRDHAARRAAGCGSTTSACSVRSARATSSAVRERFQEAFLGVWRGELRERLAQRARARRRAERPRGHDPPRDRPSTCGRPGSRSRTRYMERTLLAPPDVASLLVSAVPSPASIPIAARRRRGRAARRARSRRRSTPSRASTRTGSCAASSRWSGDAAHQLLPADERRRRREPLARVQARPASSCRCCRCRGRSSRSSSTRRASRACTCAAAGSRAAGCAGPTAARTSAPRSSG